MVLQVLQSVHEARTHARTHTHTDAHTHARARTQTHTHSERFASPCSLIPTIRSSSPLDVDKTTVADDTGSSVSCSKPPKGFEASQQK